MQIAMSGDMQASTGTSPGTPSAMHAVVVNPTCIAQLVPGSVPIGSSMCGAAG